MSDKTVAELTPEEQIVRLVQQRNALWKLLHDLAVERLNDQVMADRIWEETNKIVDDVYTVEGRNHATGDVLPEMIGAPGVALYERASGKPWL